MPNRPTKQTTEVPPEGAGFEPQGQELPPAGESNAGQELAEKDAQIAALRQELLYLRAEFENFRKRTEKRYRDALDFATEPMAKDLLPVVDNLDRALAHAKDAGPDSLEALTDGVGHVLSQLQQVLESHGVFAVPAQDERFDPNVHESLAQIPGEEDNRVVEVYEKGYLLKGRLLRPAKVVISKVATLPGDG
jgi:molecular chaperone GrpE